MMKMTKILVAEDDPRLARYYLTLLSQWNCETVVEHTGKGAIRRAATFRPDIALLSIVMPEMGGVEAGIKLLEICPGTKIVPVTESVPPETLEQLEAKGPSMTWAERTKAGVDAKHFQEALRAKS